MKQVNGVRKKLDKAQLDCFELFTDYEHPMKA